MEYWVESSKAFAEVTFDLPPIVERLGFSVLARYNVGETLFRKASGLDEEAEIFEIFSAAYADQLMAKSLRSVLHMPWRIVVLTENGVTRIGLLPPAQGPGELALQKILREITQKLVQMVDEVR